MSGCKLTPAPAPTLGFQVSHNDMPVTCALLNPSDGIKIIDVDVMDKKNLANGPLPLHFNLPTTSFALQLPVGTYSIHVFLSPATGASASLPFAGKTVLLVEQCDAQQVLCSFSDATPAPFFDLMVN